MVGGNFIPVFLSLTAIRFNLLLPVDIQSSLSVSLSVFFRIIKAFFTDVYYVPLQQDVSSTVTGRISHYSRTYVLLL